jgi:Aminoacyl-tRNA editing domain
MIALRSALFPLGRIARIQKINLITAFCDESRTQIQSLSKVASHSRVIPYRYLATTTMASLDTVIETLNELSIKPVATTSHVQTNSPAAWREALSSDAAPKSFELIKTIVYKPKTAKNAVPVPVIVIAREETETASGALGKKLNLKELRLASEDLLTEFFSLDKNSCTILFFFLMRGRRGGYGIVVLTIELGFSISNGSKCYNFS